MQKQSEIRPRLPKALLKQYQWRLVVLLDPMRKYFEAPLQILPLSQPYSSHKKDIAYEAVVYPNEQNTGYVFEKHEDAFDNYQKEYYMQIKETGDLYIMDPYIYELMGKNIMMISIISPVWDAQGNFLGVSGVDVGLDHMQEELLVSTDYRSAHLVALAEDNSLLSTVKCSVHCVLPFTDKGIATETPRFPVP